MNNRLLIFFITLLTFLGARGQEYKVKSFDIYPKDLSARTESRVDYNGRKCALIKVYAADKIAAVRGPVVGEVAGAGMEKWIYLAPESKNMEIVFENHLPLRITFRDYDYPSVSGEMVYCLYLSDGTESASLNSQISNSDAFEKEKILKEAKQAYDKDDYKKAFDLFSSQKDDSMAQYYIGLMYFKGQYVKQNYDEVIRMFRLSAEQGNEDAMFMLAYMYSRGLGVIPDKDEADKWWRELANKGNAIGQNRVGKMYEEGDGVKQDYVQAAYWYGRSAEQGSGDAQFNLGVLYDKGLGVKQDYLQAAYWYGKSAEQDNSQGQMALFYMYVEGRGVNQDYGEAYKLMKRMAEKGLDFAEYNLGVMYQYGKGVVQSREEAIKWYRKSAAQGNTDAKNALDTMGVK